MRPACLPAGTTSSAVPDTAKAYFRAALPPFSSFPAGAASCRPREA